MLLGTVSGEKTTSSVRVGLFLALADTFLRVWHKFIIPCRSMVTCLTADQGVAGSIAVDWDVKHQTKPKNRFTCRTNPGCSVACVQNFIDSQKPEQKPLLPETFVAHRCD